jgi:hypothetical protein
VLSHETALWLLRLQSDAPEVVPITLPRTERWRAASPGTRLHFLSAAADHRPLVLGGLRVTAPATAILQTAETQGLVGRELEIAAFVAIRRRLASPSQLRVWWPKGQQAILDQIAAAAIGGRRGSTTEPGAWLDRR